MITMSKPNLTEKEWDSVFTAAISSSGVDDEKKSFDSDNGSDSDTESNLESKLEKMKNLKYNLMSPLPVSPRQPNNGLRFSKKEILECKKISMEYIDNCKEVEEMALNYLSTEIHHPVISCFRELTKTDFTLILQSTKLKRNINNTEYVVMCLGMLDYLAHVMDNPLYSENFKTTSKSVGVNVSKIFAELKIIMRRWSTTDFLMKRRDTVVGYLRQLAPRFSAISDVNFNEMVKTLAPSSSPTPISNSSSQSAKSDVSLEPKGKETKMADTEEPDEDRHVLAELKINPNIFDQSNLLELNPKGKPKSHVVCNKIPSPPSKFSTQQVASKEVLKSRPSPQTATTKGILVSPPEIVDLDIGDLEVPAAKKPRLERDNTVENGNIVAPKPKPVVNAFALLMNRSKEISRANKLRRAGVPM